MKSRLTIFFLALFVLTSCKHKTTIVESSYPDGSPKHICVYLGKGENKELIKETYYYKNKKIQEEGAYKNAQRDGKWIYYYESGDIWSEGFYKEGKSDGKRVLYYPNGKIRIEGYYKENNRTGVWKFYDVKGKLLRSDTLSKSRSNNIQDIPSQEDR